MSRSIDHRTVEMNFNNRQFESGIKDSLGSLADLKKGLEFGNDRSLTDLNNGLGGIGDAVDQIASKFSLLGIIGVTALMKITDAAIDAGVALVKSLTVAPLADGFSKYEQKTEAIQTIMNATGLELEAVNEQMDKLLWFTDETSFRFVDMVTNIGKFTGAGVGLDVAVDAMQGIATWSALSGANVETTSRAMYMMSNAISQGSMRLLQWRSLENANLATVEFKQTLIDTARELGTLDKAGKTTKGTLVDIANLPNTLHEDWATTDVLLSALEKYGGAATKIYEYATAHGITASQAMREMGLDIENLGVRGFKAAQEAKTFTEAVEAVKDAVSTGWMVTAEHIFGDYHEAVELWTDLTEALWDVFAAGGEARNELLAEWKELGGRDDLVDAFWNIWEAVEKIAGAIGEAFREIFPAMTAERLFAITEALREFTERLIISDETAGYLKETFKGVFAVLSIFKQIIGAIFKVVGSLLRVLWPAGDGLLMISAALGRWVAGIDEALKSSRILETIVEGLGGVFQTIGEWIANAVLGLGYFVTSLAGVERGVEGFSTFADKLTRFFKDLSYLFKGIFSGDLQLIIESFWHVIAAIFGENIADVLTDFVESILYSESKVLGVFASMGSAAEKFAGGAGLALYNLKWSWHAFREGYATGETEMVTGTLTAFATMGNAVFLFSERLKLSLGNARWAWHAFKEGYQTGETEMTSTSLTLFAKLGNALFLFTEKIKAFLAAITLQDVLEVIRTIISGGLMVVIGRFIHSLTNITSSVGDFTEGITDILDELKGVLVSYQTQLKAGALLKIAIAVGILVLSLIALSMVDPEKLAAALVAMSLAFAQLLGAMAILNNVMSFTGGYGKSILALIAMSVAIVLLVGAVKKLSKIDPDAAMNGVVVIAALAGILVGLSRYLDKNTATMARAALGFMIFGASLYLLIGAIKLLGKMDTAVLTKGLIGVSALMAGIVLFVNNLQNTGLKPSTALIFIGLAIALRILAKAVKEIGSLPLGELAKGLIGLGGALGMLVIAINNLPVKGLVGAGVGIVILSVGLLILSKALKSFGGMDWATIVRGLFALGGSLLILAVALNAMRSTIPGAIALGLVAAGLWLLVPVLALLGVIPLKQIGIALLALAGIFVVLGLAGFILAPLGPMLLVLAAAFALVGAAMYLIGAGMLKFALGLTALTVLGAAGVAAVTALVMGVVELLPKIIAKIGESLMIMLHMLIEAGPLFFQTWVVLFSSLVDALIQTIPKAVEGVLLLIVTVMEKVLEQMPRIVDLGIKFVLALIQGCVERTPQMVRAGIDLILAFIRGIASKLPDIIDTAFKVIIRFINGLAEAIRTNSKALSNAVANLIWAIIQAIFNMMGSITQVGKNIVSGLITGIKSMATALANAARNAVKGALDAAKRLLGINSPSTVFAEIGRNTGQGLIIGMKSMAGGVETASENLGKTAVSSLKDSFSRISDILESDVDLTPTITPVLDMEEVKKDLKSAFDETQGLNVSTSADNASDISNLARKRINEEDGEGGSHTDNTDNSTLSITNHYHVRSDSDIRKISQDLRDVLDRYNLAKGVPA
jgi:phage-related protein